ncbi:hypothetical protein [Nocardioides sp.]|uniref:hypothetical protein n=1 Tax=Nocardioides sp. TaxID=35761 RepID=UPI0039E31370
MGTPASPTEPVGRQRLVVFLALAALVLALWCWPNSSREGDAAQAALPSCPQTPTSFSGLVNGNTLSLGNGTTVTPCIANAPIHMRIGYSDGASGASVAGSTTQFTSDGITFPDGKYTRSNTGCVLGVRSDSKIAMPTILRFADGTQSAGPTNLTTYKSGITCPSTNLYTQAGWPTTGVMDSDKMVVHMRLKNLKISKNAYLTVVPQSDPANPTAAGTGEYKLTFTPQDQSEADWNIGDSCVYTDLWLRADTHIKVNILSINTSVYELATGDGIWGSILSQIASWDGIPGLEMDGWVYYMNTNKGSDCTGTPTTLALPNTNIGVTP